MHAALLAVVLAGDPVPLEDNPHYLRAVAAWDGQRWDEAAAAFGEAYAFDPRPEFVFARARAMRLSGDCEGALPVFEQFLALDPPAEAAADARVNVDACTEELDAAAPHDEPEPSAPAPVLPDTGPPDLLPPPVARDPLGHALLWPGVAIAATGGVLVQVSLNAHERADDAADEQAYRDELRRAPAMSRTGIALCAVGGALIVSGITRFAVLQARRRRAGREVAGGALRLRWGG